MDPEHFHNILSLCEAGPADDRGFREFPPKTTLSLYLAKHGVPLMVASIEALAVKGQHVHARTTKGDLYVLSLEDVFAVNIEGRAQAKSGRRAGFG
jgi:hypothetical protein